MPDLPLWIIAVFGITFSIADASLLKTPRAWVMKRSVFLSKLLSCYYCLGFWVSLGLWCAICRNDDLKNPIVVAAMYTFSGAAGAYLLNKLTMVLEFTQAKIQVEMVRDRLIQDMSEDIDAND